jgi:hypothetical protein
VSCSRRAGEARPLSPTGFLGVLRSGARRPEDARQRILAGETDVVFPAGTFRWHRLFGFPRDEMQAAFFAMNSAFG